MKIQINILFLFVSFKKKIAPIHNKIISGDFAVGADWNRLPYC